MLRTLHGTDKEITSYWRCIYIACPSCKMVQAMEYNSQSKVWFQIAPYCCEVMEHRDTVLWNTLIDAEIVKALRDQHGIHCRI